MAGKGDKPRSCFNKQFRDNYNLINWKSKKRKKKACNSKGKIIQYYK